MGVQSNPLELNRADIEVMADAALLSTMDYTGHTHNTKKISHPTDHGSHFQFTELFNQYVTEFVDR